MLGVMDGLVSPLSMLVALTSLESSLARLTIPTTVGMPRPSSPTSHAVSPSYSISRTRRHDCRACSSAAQYIRCDCRQQHTRQQKAGQPARCLANTRTMSHIVAEVNHSRPTRL